MDNKNYKCVTSRIGNNYFIIVEITDALVYAVKRDGSIPQLNYDQIKLDENEEPVETDVDATQLTEVQINNYLAKIAETQNQDNDEEKTYHNEFYISRIEYNRFMQNPLRKHFVIIIESGPNHPHGRYILSKSRIQKIVNAWEKCNDVDWCNNDKHANSNVPLDLRDVWFPKN